jgi:hypothetical protein
MLQCFQEDQREQGSTPALGLFPLAASCPASTLGLQTLRKLAQGPLSSQAVTCEHVLGLFLLHNESFRKLTGGLYFFFFL